MSISQAVNPGCAIRFRLSTTMRCSEVGRRMRAGVALTSARVTCSHSIKSGLNLVAEER